MVIQTGDNKFGVARWIVDPTAGLGTHTTITSALASASSGQTIALRPATYTENFTWPAGINIVAYTADAFTPNVTIVGNITCTDAGSRSISGVRLQTNAAALLTVSGSAATVVNLNNCYLNCTNNTGITFSSSSGSAQININNCKGDLGTTGIGLFSDSSAGSLVILNSDFSNSGNSDTASTVSSGALYIRFSTIAFPITTSGTAAQIQAYSCNFIMPTNVTSLTHGTTSSDNIAVKCAFSGGTSSAISVSVNASLLLSECEVSSSNAAAIAGAGTVVYGILSFTGSGNAITTTTQTELITRYGAMLSGIQPAFSAYLAATVTNKTGNGASYVLGTDALTEIYDQGADFNTNGTFTAPYTGKYQLSGGVLVTGCTAATNNNFILTTSNRSYISQNARAASAANINAYINVLADMDAADTATVGTVVVGEAGDTDDIFGDATINYTYFNGRLAN